MICLEEGRIIRNCINAGRYCFYRPKTRNQILNLLGQKQENDNFAVRKTRRDVRVVE